MTFKSQGPSAIEPHSPGLQNTAQARRHSGALSKLPSNAAGLVQMIGVIGADDMGIRKDSRDSAAAGPSSRNSGMFQFGQRISCYVNDWSITQQLGVGSFGSVHVARHMMTGEKAAIKMLPKKYAGDLPFYENEKRVMELLSGHPNIIPLLSAIEDEKYWCLVMELGAGDLALQIEKHGALSYEKSRQFTRQLLDACGYIHSFSIVHNDIKLENLMVDKAMTNVKIADFGISRQLSAGDSCFTQYRGTLAYAAPELMDQKGYAQPVDIWAIGVCAHWIAKGKPPFRDDNAGSLKADMLTWRFKDHKDLDRTLRRFLNKTFVVAPNKRASANELLREAWITEGEAAKIDAYSAMNTKSPATRRKSRISRSISDPGAAVMSTSAAAEQGTLRSIQEEGRSAEQPPSRASVALEKLLALDAIDQLATEDSLDASSTTTITTTRPSTYASNGAQEYYLKEPDERSKLRISTSLPLVEERRSPSPLPPIESISPTTATDTSSDTKNSPNLQAQVDNISLKVQELNIQETPASKSKLSPLQYRREKKSKIKKKKRPVSAKEASHSVERTHLPKCHPRTAPKRLVSDSVSVARKLTKTSDAKSKLSPPRTSDSARRAQGKVSTTVSRRNPTKKTLTKQIPPSGLSTRTSVGAPSKLKGSTNRNPNSRKK